MCATDIRPGRKTTSMMPTSCHKSIPVKEEKAPDAVISRSFSSFPGYILLSLIIVNAVRSPSGVREPKSKVKHCLFAFYMIMVNHAKLWNVKICMACTHASEARGGR